MRRGATLVELVITVAVIGIIAMIAVPRFARAQDGTSADAAARRLVSELCAIRQRAIVSRTSATVTVVVGRGTVKVAGIDTTGLGCDGGGFDLAESPYGVTVLKVTFPAGTFQFDGHGWVGSEGSIAIGRGAVARVVTVSAAGMISWQ